MSFESQVSGELPRGPTSSPEQAEDAGGEPARASPLPTSQETSAHVLQLFPTSYMMGGSLGALVSTRAEREVGGWEPLAPADSLLHSEGSGSSYHCGSPRVLWACYPGISLGASSRCIFISASYRRKTQPC